MPFPHPQNLSGRGKGIQLSIMRYTSCIVILLLLSCCTSPSSVEQTANDDSLTLIFTGDVLLDRGVRQQIDRHGVAWLFDDVADLFHDSDATVINLECPLTDISTPIGKQYIFRADTRWAHQLNAAGITHAALANNHTNDQGLQGIASTVKCLGEAGITPLGCGKTVAERFTPVIIEKGDIRVAVFNAVLLNLENWTPVSDGNMIVCETDAATLAKAVREYRQKNEREHIVVVLHWGTEFQSSPSFTQRLQARQLISAGADAIIGHHPHVIQSVDTIAGRTVMYSLGNFVFDQHNPLAKKALIAKITVKADTLRVSSIPVDINNCKPVPIVCSDSY